MKKNVLNFGIGCFALAMVCSWFAGKFWFGFLFTIVAIALGTVCILLKKHASVRSWFVIFLAIIAAAMLCCSVTMISMKNTKTHDNIEVTTTEEDKSNIQDDCEEKNDEESEELEESVNVVNEEEIVIDEESEELESNSKSNSKNKVNISSSETVKNDTNVVEKRVEVPVTVEKVVEKKVEVPVEVEKIVEKKVEVPVEVEKVVEKTVTEYVEVPVIEYVEVEVPSTTTQSVATPTPAPTPTQTPQYNYTGDPTSTNYGYGYTGDPTSGNYGYGYTGDPTSGNYGYNYQSVKISGPTSVTQGESYTYTISGVSSVSLSKLKVPDHVYAETLGGNRFRLTFADGWTGSYSIGYGSSTITVKVKA